MTNIPLQPIKLVPHWLAMTLCILFAILYAVWLLPNTIFIRNTCLIAGAVLSLWLIFQNRGIFYQRRTWPILLIGGLLIWVSIHLFFIGLEFDTQYAEYTKIWKKIALGCVFAIGLGLAISSHFADDKKSMQYWLIVRIAFLLPVTIYFLKLIINTWAAYKGIELSPYLQDSRAIFTDPYAIARPGYVFFILPAIALAIGTMTNAIESNRFAIKNHLLDLASMVLTIACLFIEHDKLGVLLVIFLLLAAGCILTKGMAKRLSRQNLLILFLGLLAVLVISLSSYRQNAQWSSLIADAKVAVQVDAIDDWKYESAKSENAQHEVIERLPVNEYGQKVNV